ncbi:MAG: DUF5320 domain-containing protein [Chloroflexota bacterium]
MPGFDRTGPQGAGPRTGRGMGSCNPAGFVQENAAFRGGFGFRRAAAGRGWRRRFRATGASGWEPPTPEQEAADLKAQAEWLKEQLAAVQKRLEALT